MAGINYFDSLVGDTNPARRTSRDGFADAQYGLGVAGARSRYGQSMADLQRRRGAASRQYQDVMGEYQRQFQGSKEPMVSSFAQRGLGRSGIFNKAMEDYLGGQQRSLASLVSGFGDQQAQFELERQAAQNALQNELDWMALQKQQQVVNDAAELRRWAPMTGLFG